MHFLLFTGQVLSVAFKAPEDSNRLERETQWHCGVLLGFMPCHIIFHKYFPLVCLEARSADRHGVFFFLICFSFFGSLIVRQVPRISPKGLFRRICAQETEFGGALDRSRLWRDYDSRWIDYDYAIGTKGDYVITAYWVG